MKWRWLALIVQYGLLGAACSVCHAQTKPPAIRSESSVVLVPTLVKTKSGEIVSGLSARDFIIEDDGVEQSVQLDDSPEADPISVVVAVQQGRTAAMQLEEAPGGRHSDAPLSSLGTMLESYIGESKATVAVVAFDSRVQLLQDFTEDIPAAADELRRLGPGDDGAVILDALLYSLEMLDRHPGAGRRVILLISESRDHGSHVAKLQDVVQRVSVSNTLVYSISFSPARSKFMSDVKNDRPNAGQPDLMAPVVMAANGLRKNVASTVAQLTGGEYETFGSKRVFDKQMDAVSGDDRSRYLLSFQPTDPKPGPHVVKVRLRNPARSRVVTARSMYWAIASQGEAGTG
jgi:VWFA-related protein